MNIGRCDANLTNQIVFTDRMLSRRFAKLTSFLLSFPQCSVVKCLIKIPAVFLICNFPFH